LVAIISSGFIPVFGVSKLEEVVAKWRTCPSLQKPELQLTDSAANAGPAPSASALSQHLNLLRKKHGGPVAPAAQASTPAKSKKPASFIRSAGQSSRKSASKHTLFGSTYQTKGRYQPLFYDDDDDEVQEGDTSASPVSSYLAVNRGRGRAPSSDSASPLPETADILAGTPSKAKSKGGKEFRSPYTSSPVQGSSVLGKRSRHRDAEREEEYINDDPVDYKPHLGFMQQLREEAEKDPIKKEPVSDDIFVVDAPQAKKNRTSMVSYGER
jgi:hypothetical protein